MTNIWMKVLVVFMERKGEILELFCRVFLLNMQVKDEAHAIAALSDCQDGGAHSG